MVGIHKVLGRGRVAKVGGSDEGVGVCGDVFASYTFEHHPSHFTVVGLDREFELWLEILDCA